jgi:hypothetical protein
VYWSRYATNVAANSGEVNAVLAKGLASLTSFLLGIGKFLTFSRLITHLNSAALRSGGVVSMASKEKARVTRRIAVLCFAALAGAHAQYVTVKPVGPQRVVFLLVDAKGDGGGATAAQVREAVLQHPNSLDAYIKSVSHGKSGLQVELAGPKRYTRPASQPIGDCTVYPDDIMKVFDPEVDFTRFDEVVVMTHGLLDRACRAGSSSIGKQSYPTSRGPALLAVSFVHDSLHYVYDPQTAERTVGMDFTRTTQPTLVHEFIHSLGVGFHADGYLCGSEILRADTTGCRAYEYGDPFDIMGRPNQGSVLQALFQEQLGWLAGASIREVSVTGDYDLYPLDGNGPGAQVLKIPLPRKLPMGIDGRDTAWDIDYLSLEYRSMTGFDFRDDFERWVLKKGGPDAYFPENQQGVLIHAVACVDPGECPGCGTPGECRTSLLDMTPNSIDPDNPIDEFVDGMLTLNRSFTVPGNAIRIRTTEVLPGRSVKVRVEIGDAAIGDRKGKRPDGFAPVVLHRSGRTIAHIVIPAGRSVLELAGLDGTRYRLRVEADGTADASGLKRGMYFFRDSQVGKFILP